MRTSWRLLRNYRDLRLVLSAGLVSMVGDWILRIGLVYYVYVLTGSTLASALVMLTSFVPLVILGSVAGVFVDRWSRRRTMFVSNLLLAAGLLPLLLVHDAHQVWIAYVVLFWEGSVAQFFAPAEQALVPLLVPDEQLLSTNALSGQVNELSRLAGSALGGVAAAVGGLIGVTVIDAASFVVSAALIGLMRTSGRVEVAETVDEAPTEAFAHRLAALRREWSDGLRLIRHHPALRVLTTYVLIAMLGEGVMGTLFAPWVRAVLHGDNVAYGLILSVQAIGGIVGGLFAVGLGQRFSAAKLLGYGSLLFGLVDLAIFLYPLGYVAVWPALVGMVIVGLPGAVATAGLMTLFQRNTVDAFRGRVFGAIGVVQGIAVLIGTLGAGWLGTAIGILPVLSVQGACGVIGGLAVLVMMRRAEAAEARVQADGVVDEELASVATGGAT